MSHTVRAVRIPTPIAQIAPDGKPTPRQRRRIIIQMCLRRQKPGTGSSLSFLKRRTAMNSWPDLRPVLTGIPWAITGAVATRAYMPERMTQDLGILVHRADCQAAWQRFQVAGYEVSSQLDAPYFVARSPSGIEIDVICADFPWVKEALAAPHVDAANYPVLDLPYLILMKLMANRAIDIGDMTRMLGLASPEQLEQVEAIVARYNPQDSEDLQALILLGNLEMEPPEGEHWL